MNGETVRTADGLLEFSQRAVRFVSKTALGWCKQRVYRVILIGMGAAGGGSPQNPFAASIERSGQAGRGKREGTGCGASDTGEIKLEPLERLAGNMPLWRE